MMQSDLRIRPLTEADLPAVHLEYRDGEIMERVKNLLSDKVEWIDLTDDSF